jgi:hypothetical protein
MVKGTDQVRRAFTQRSFRDSKGFAASRSTWSSRTEEIMYATRTTFAATTAVIAAKVELPMNAGRLGQMRVVEEVQEDAPFHMYFSDAKYDAIGTIPRERLKMTSLKSTPVLRMERLVDGRNRRSGMASYPCSIVCVNACAETPRALILR